MTTANLKNIALSTEMMDANAISAFTEELYSKKDITVFEVYPTSVDINAGTPLTADSLLGEIASNDAILSNQVLCANISAEMTQVLEIYSYQPKAEQDIIIYWGETDENGNEIYTNLKFDEVSENFEKRDDKDIPILTDHNKIMRYKPVDDEHTYYIIAICHTYKTPGRKKLKIVGKNYFMVRGYIAYAFSEHDDWKKAWYEKHNLISNGMSDGYPLAGNIKNISALFYNAKRLIYINASYQYTTNVENYGNCFKGCENLMKFEVDSYNFFIHNIYTACNMFKGVANLLYTNIRLPQNGTDNGFISGIFSGCTNLSVDIASLFPKTGFTAKSINIYNIFSNCKKIFGTVPAHLLWKDATAQFNDTKTAFDGCNDEIRNQVPESWGGLKPNINKIESLSENTSLHIVNGKITDIIDLTDLNYKKYSKWTLDIPNNNYIVKIENIKFKNTYNDYAVLDFGDGTKQFIVSPTTTITHTYTTAGIYTIKIENTIINAKMPSSTSCLVDVDFTDTQDFKFIKCQFSYASEKLSAIHGDMSKLVPNTQSELFSNSTFTNLNFMSSLTNINTIYAKQFYYCQNLSNANILSTFGNLTHINDYAFQAKNAGTGQTQQYIDFNVLSNCSKLQDIGNKAFVKHGYNFALPASISAIQLSAFYRAYDNNPITVSFVGKDEATIKAMDNYPFEIKAGSTINCLDTDGNILSSFTVQM